MAELERDRVRAAKLRKQRKDGKLSTVNARWLDAYELRTTMKQARKQRSLPSGSKHTPTKPAERHDSGPPNVTADPELGAPVEGVPVHETQHLTDVITPETYTWEPTVPPPAEGAEAEPPVPGVEPPTVGAPIVDEAAASEGEPAAPPTTALAFAGIVTFITKMGIKSAIELAGDVPIPEALRGMAEDAEGKVLAEVGAAAFRVGVKYGPKTALPYQDECTVAVALAGSLVCIFRAHKVKQLEKDGDQVETVDEPPTEAVRRPDARIVDAEVVAPTSAKEPGIPPHLASLLEG